MDGSSVNVDTDGDGILDCEEILGCTDTSAINYDSTATESVNDMCIIYGALSRRRATTTQRRPLTTEIIQYRVQVAPTRWHADDPEATFDDGTCELMSCAGCTDPSACDNYDPEATIDDGSCIYADECGVCGNGIPEGA